MPSGVSYGNLSSGMKFLRRISTGSEPSSRASLSIITSIQ